MNSADCDDAALFEMTFEFIRADIGAAEPARDARADFVERYREAESFCFYRVWVEHSSRERIENVDSQLDADLGHVRVMRGKDQSAAELQAGGQVNRVKRFDVSFDRSRNSQYAIIDADQTDAVKHQLGTNRCDAFSPQGANEFEFEQVR